MRKTHYIPHALIGSGVGAVSISVSASLDLGTGILTATFDKLIEFRYIDLSYWHINPTSANDASGTTLGGGAATLLSNDKDGTVFQLQLGAAAKYVVESASSNTAYLEIEQEGLMASPASTANAPDADLRGSQITIASADSRAPVAQSATLDFNTGVLTVTVDEYVSASSVDPSKLSLRGYRHDADLDTTAYTLAGATVASSPANAASFVISLPAVLRYNVQMISGPYYFFFVSLAWLWGRLFPSMISQRPYSWGLFHLFVPRAHSPPHPHPPFALFDTS